MHASAFHIYIILSKWFKNKFYRVFDIGFVSFTIKH